MEMMKINKAAALRALEVLRTAVDLLPMPGKVQIVSNAEWSQFAPKNLQYPDVYCALELLLRSPIGTKCKIPDGGKPEIARKRVASYGNRFGVSLRTHTANGFVYIVSTIKNRRGKALYKDRKAELVAVDGKRARA
jgi:hypothetical protein